MIENILLVWLDAKIEDNKSDFWNIINTFTDGDENIQFLGSTANEKSSMIISKSFGQQIVLRMRKVNGIFIFCSNRKNQER